MGNKALLVVSGSAPKAVASGETYQGVKVLSVSGDKAVVEINGQKSELRVGAAPVSVGSGSGRGTAAHAGRITLLQGRGGHFFADGSINAFPINFMVDTGATSIAIGMSDARRIGIDLARAERTRMSTANGIAQGWRVVLPQVRVADVTVYDVEAVVVPDMPFALLGNSFLNRFSMVRVGDTMVLERRL
jgi:aspartyl protease family protein